MRCTRLTSCLLARVMWMPYQSVMAIPNPATTFLSLPHAVLLLVVDKMQTSYLDQKVAGFLKGMVEGAKDWLDETWDFETLSNNPRPATSASNEPCVVQHAIIEDHRILLTADVGPSGL